VLVVEAVFGFLVGLVIYGWFMHRVIVSAIRQALEEDRAARSGEVPPAT
jgi:hypothetical protein